MNFIHKQLQLGGYMKFFDKEDVIFDKLFIILKTINPNH
jgi:hypothetical protein